MGYPVNRKLKASVRTEEVVASRRLLRLTRLSAVMLICVFAVPFTISARAEADPTGSSSASIGVEVDQPTTTTTAPATMTTATTTVSSGATSPSNPSGGTSGGSTTGGSGSGSNDGGSSDSTTTAPTTTTTEDTLPDILPAPVDVQQPDDKGFASQLESAARVTKELFKGIASGKPVADVVQAVLPQNVATVVVPAVRTASTFVFPIGLAAAVIAFLVLQQRVDASDPKLTAAPLAHDDDEVTFS
jgi:hypothetical protein